jgi:hypothetical protein
LSKQPVRLFELALPKPNMCDIDYRGEFGSGMTGEMSCA